MKIYVDKMPKSCWECPLQTIAELQVKVKEYEQEILKLKTLPKQILEEIREYNFARFFADETEIIELRELDELLKNMEERWQIK